LKNINEAHNKNKYINKRTKTAKLDRELFFQIGNGNLKISGNAINFMLYTINYVAKDGRIYCEPSQIRKRLNMQYKTWKRVISELKLLNLLSEKDGFLYSRFHVLSNGEKHDKGYVQNIKALTSNEILSLNKKKKRLFLYVASFSRMGIAKSVSVESLYSNKYHSGVNYIESYQELADILIEFVQKGYFVVYINGQRYDETSSDFEQALHSYCGYNPVTGKARMSKTKKHKIGIQIHEQLTKEVSPNQSSKEEFKYFATQYHIYHELLRPETIPFFISVQNELFDLFGTVGLELYRQALISYFSAEEENVLYHDLMSDQNETKAINTMMDFYLIKDIQNIILNVLTENKNEEDPITQYFMDKNHLSELVRYFVQKSSDNQKILLDSELEKHGIQLSELIRTTSGDNILDNHWLLLNQTISDIYDHIHLDVEDTGITEDKQKEIVREWAEKGILAKHEWIEQSVEQLKNKIAPLVKYRKRISISTAHSFSPKEKGDVTDSYDSYAEERRRMRKQHTERVKELSKRFDIDRYLASFNY
jgi:hypothetical protein